MQTLISKHITLERLLRSDIAQRHNIKEQYNPPKEIVTKLTALAVNLLDPIEEAVKKHYPEAVMNTTSGWRCPKVNEKAGGQPGSQHMAGEAEDREFRMNGKEANVLLAQLVLKEGIVFDQMILEYGTLNNPEWIHFSWDLDKKVQRGMIMRIGYDKADKLQVYQTTKATVLNLK